MGDVTHTIVFEGRPLACRAGLNVAVALWENGIKVLSHSHKFGRPRGLTCARGHCMGCLMRIDGEPNVRACRTPVREGMVVARQGSGAPHGPVLHKVLDTGGHLLPVGFYFKWFTRPDWLRKAFLGSLRPLTGVGRIPDRPRPARLTDGAPVPAPAAVDTLVVGAGAAGLRAALSAPGPVLLVDDLPACGGHRRSALDRVAGAGDGLIERFPRLSDLRERLENDVRRVAAADRIEIRPETRVVGGYQPDMLLLKDASGLVPVRADSIVWAGGAWDRIGDFENNDLPGLMGPRALYRLVAIQGLRVAGSGVVVFGQGLDLWLSAALLHAMGARVTLVLDAAGDADGRALVAARDLGWALHLGLDPQRARGRDGALAGMTFANGDGSTRLRADIAVSCSRAKPAHDIPYQLGADLVLDPRRGGFAPRSPGATGDAVSVVGEAAGDLPEDLCTEAAE